MRVWKQLLDIVNRDVKFEDEPKRIFVLFRCLYLVLTVYYLSCIAVAEVCGCPEMVKGSVFLLLILFIVAHATYRFRASRNLLLFFAFTVLSIVVYLNEFGRVCGVQNFLFVLAALYFFTTYRKNFYKVTVTFALFLIRLLLVWHFDERNVFFTAQAMGESAFIVLNSAAVFAMLALICGFYSSSIDSAEQKLVRYNAELKKQATTDPLTGLPNRRTMIGQLNAKISLGSQAFTIALGDIDLFKNINDVWGHNVGDEVLEQIGEVFRRRMDGIGTVCRWGGEEFLFYFPDQNGDLASGIISGVLDEIRQLVFETQDGSFQITMTFGVEEYDFKSDVEEMISKVDKKMYMGKKSGRDRVVY